MANKLNSKYNLQANGQSEQYYHILKFMLRFYDIDHRQN